MWDSVNILAAEQSKVCYTKVMCIKDTSLFAPGRKAARRCQQDQADGRAIIKILFIWLSKKGFITPAFATYVTTRVTIPKLCFRPCLIAIISWIVGRIVARL
jgi:hypothetical protein